MTLLERTQTLLDAELAKGTSLRQIARDSDGAVQYDWLKKFAAGMIGNPGVNQIEALHGQLSRNVAA